MTHLLGVSVCSVVPGVVPAAASDGLRVARMLSELSA